MTPAVSSLRNVPAWQAILIEWEDYAEKQERLSSTSSGLNSLSLQDCSSLCYQMQIQFSRLWDKKL